MRTERINKSESPQASHGNYSKQSGLDGEEWLHFTLTRLRASTLELSSCVSMPGCPYIPQITIHSWLSLKN